MGNALALAVAANPCADEEVEDDVMRPACNDAVRMLEECGHAAHCETCIGVGLAKEQCGDETSRVDAAHEKLPRHRVHKGARDFGFRE